MKPIAVLFFAAALSVALSGCGIKPATVDPPQGHKADRFPHTYPDPATDPATGPK